MKPAFASRGHRTRHLEERASAARGVAGDSSVLSHSYDYRHENAFQRDILAPCLTCHKAIRCGAEASGDEFFAFFDSNDLSIYGGVR